MTVPSLSELATFTGRAEASYNAFATEALKQAALLLRLATGLTEYPTDPDLLQLAKNGIMDMADKIYLSSPLKSKTALAGPFASEVIGTYSYSMKSVSTKIKAGEDTGVLWFDLAVSQLKTGKRRGAASGHVIIFENDGRYQTEDPSISIVPGPAYPVVYEDPYYQNDNFGR